MNKFKLLLACGALCATSQFALAGGPEMPPPDHSTIFIGLGGAFDYVQYKNRFLAGEVDFDTDTATGVVTLNDVQAFAAHDYNSVFGLSPIGQLGYEYFFGSGGFFGIKGVFNFVNKNTSWDTTSGGPLPFNTTAQLTPEVTLNFNEMVQAMLEGGVRVGDNAFYMEAGYAALWTTQTIRQMYQQGAPGVAGLPASRPLIVAGTVLATQNQTLNGGTIGIGYRHYFWDVLSLDAVYTYSLFADGTAFGAAQADTVPGEGTTNTVADAQSVKLTNVAVQDIMLTVNYNFNF